MNVVKPPPQARSTPWRLAGLGSNAWAACVSLLLLLGCNTPPLVPSVSLPVQTLVREGRLFLRVDTTPPTITQADISLQGSPEVGQLTLYGPLGISHGLLRWAPG